MTWTTLVELEFFHIQEYAETTQHSLRWGPTPDEMLTPTANTPVRTLTSNGILLWLHNGSILHGTWSAHYQSFFTRDEAQEVPWNTIRGWCALATPIAHL